MELVRGVKITRFCDQERLTTPQRLGLFIQVCLAIQHAHQKGVIHRDIKPSNVLITIVDGAPVPKVIDFGIAKATSGQSLGDHTVFTAHDQFIGTPAYVSPEQAALSGLDVDTRSDIYSLGVLLYELLTGKTPFDQAELLESGIDELRRTLREKDPHRPSLRVDRLQTEELTQTAIQRRVEPRRLKLLLTGDLDWIVMKSLEKDRNRRYQTVNDLATEVRRYLNHEPVSARPPSWHYQLQKLFRRNRTAFVAVTVAVLALVLGFGTSTWLFFREREAKQQQMVLNQEAEARANLAQAAVMLSRNRYAEADQLVDNLQIPVAEPSLEAAGVFRSLGDWNAIHGRWRVAADRFLKLLEANQVDKSDLTDEATRDLLRVGPALLVAGDLAGYRQLVQQSIARFAGTTNPVAAEQVVKISAIKPIDKPTAEALAPLAKIIEQSMRVSPRSKWESYLTSWQVLSLSLFEYRRGDFDRAIFWAQKSIAYPDPAPTRIAISHLVLAMSFNRLHQPERAQIELLQGQQAVELNLPAKLDQISQ
jgi:tetratricopeptide (TPR) repeat protein